MIKNINLLCGAIPALITPFKGEHIDYRCLKIILDRFIESEIKAIVIAGSTGEGNLITTEERTNLYRFIKNNIPDTILLIAALSSPSTKLVIEMGKIAENNNMDMLLVANPYYTKPNNQGIYCHFEALAHSVKLPIILYNIPSRTGYNVPISLIKKLYSDKIIVGLKESGKNIDHVKTLSEYNNKKLIVLSGDDIYANKMIKSGARGCISVLANLLPNICKVMYDPNTSNNEREKIFNKLLTLCQALNLETNPQGIKYAMHLQGFCENTLRLPLLPVTDLTKKRIEDTIIIDD